MAGIFEMIQHNDMLKLFLILAVAYLVYSYWKKEGMNSLYQIYEGVDNVKDDVPAQPTQQPTLAPPQKPADAAAAPSNAADPQQQHLDQVVAGKTQVSPADLLPKYDEANEFAKQNPVNDLLKEQNFLISGYHMGINTVMQSNKIPYWDLRSAPPIPKQTVSPFLNSSYETPMGAGRRQFELNV